MTYACFLISLAACFRLELHSSYARPAPKPTPMNAGHALRLNRRTEKTTPKPRPRVDLTRRLDRQWSHYKNKMSETAESSGVFRSGELANLLVEKCLTDGSRDSARGRGNGFLSHGRRR